MSKIDKDDELIVTDDINVDDATKIEDKKPKRKTKEQIKKEKAINATMVQLTDKNRHALGIVSVQPEKNVFLTVNDMFVKIYSLKGVELTDNRKKILIDALCKISPYRMRITTLSYKNSKSPLLFLTVFFPGNLYSDVVDTIVEFDEVLQNLMNDKFKIQFSTCNVGDVFMFIHMNFHGQMKKITSQAVVRKSTNLRRSFFQEIKEKVNGYRFVKSGKIGNTFICSQYPEVIEDFMSKLKRLGCTFLSCIDFQVVDKQFIPYFNKSLEQLYNSPVEDDLDEFYNLTFAFNMIYENEKEQKKCEPVIKQIMADSGLVVSEGVGMHEKIAYSIASMGLVDFHCSYNVNIDILSKLFG